MRFPALARFLFFISYFSFFIFIVSATPAFAQIPSAHSGQTTNQLPNNSPSPNTNPDVPNNLHNWTQNVMIEVMSALTCQLVGIDPTNPNQQCLGVDQKTGKIGFVPSGSGQGGGAVGVMGNMISMLYTPPLQTSDYFRHLASSFGITKHAYAQNSQTGFESLSPLMGIWKTFRDIVYLVFVIVFVIIGVGIMLRLKIDPRTVMGIQNQIPKIIIGILLVTFSFAIAGFMIDLMYILSYLFVNIAVQANPQLASDITQIVTSTNPFSAANASFGIGGTIGGTAGHVGEFIGSIFDNPRGRLIIAALTGLLGKFVGGDILQILAKFPAPLVSPGGALAPIIDFLAKGSTNAIIGYVAGGFSFVGGYMFANYIMGFIGNLIALIVISIAVVWAMFRLWIVLLMAYIYILIDVVLAPFWIIGGLIPGSPINISGWLRDLGSNLLAFPVTIGMFLLGKLFIDAFNSSTAPSKFSPPLIGNPGDTSAFGALIGLGIILMTPNVVNMVKAALKAPKMDIGGAMKAIGAGTGAIKETAASMFAYRAKMPKPGESEGLPGVLRRIFR